MSVQLYQEVALTRDMPEQGMRAGDVATFVDRVPAPDSIEDGAVLEIFNALGDSIAIVTVPISAIAPLRADQLPTVRVISRAA